MRVSVQLFLPQGEKRYTIKRENQKRRAKP